MPEPTEPAATAAALNGLTWELLGQAERRPADDDRLVHAAHASAHFWGVAGTVLHRARAEYLCSRVYATLGRAEPALHHAERCAALTAEAGEAAADFDHAYAHEARARALAAAGRLPEAAAARDAARAVPIADPEDRAIVDGDLAAGPWFGLDA